MKSTHTIAALVAGAFLAAGAMAQSNPSTGSTSSSGGTSAGASKSGAGPGSTAGSSGGTATSSGNMSKTPDTGAGASKSGSKSGSGGSVSGDDRKFMEKAAMDGLAEVELGKLAQQKASNDQVKQFGTRMATDHQKANDELKGIASSKGVQLPTAPDSKHQKNMDKLAKAKNFDHEYMEMMVKDHKDTVSEFRKHSTGSKDPEVKAFAAKTLPTLEDHLKMAQDTEKAVKSGGKGSSSGSGSSGSKGGSGSTGSSGGMGSSGSTTGSSGSSGSSGSTGSTSDTKIGSSSGTKK
jgi:putative membrane protein